MEGSREKKRKVGGVRGEGEVKRENEKGFRRIYTNGAGTMVM